MVFSVSLRLLIVHTWLCYYVLFQERYGERKSLIIHCSLAQRLNGQKQSESHLCTATTSVTRMTRTPYAGPFEGRRAAKQRERRLSGRFPSSPPLSLRIPITLQNEQEATVIKNKDQVCGSNSQRALSLSIAQRAPRTHAQTYGCDGFYIIQSECSRIPRLI